VPRWDDIVEWNFDNDSAFLQQEQLSQAASNRFFQSAESSDTIGKIASS